MLSVEDRLLIDELLARYDRSLDLGDKAEFLSLFTESGTWVSPMMGTFSGRAALDAWFDDYWGEPSQFHNGQHRVSNTIVEASAPDRARLWCNWMLVGAGEHGPQLLVMGNYLDELVKQDGRWLFEQRTIEIVAERP